MTKCIIRLFIIRLDGYMNLSTVLFLSEFFIILIRNKMHMYGLGDNGSCAYQELTCHPQIM